MHKHAFHYIPVLNALRIYSYSSLIILIPFNSGKMLTVDLNAIYIGIILMCRCASSFSLTSSCNCVDLVNWFNQVNHRLFHSVVHFLSPHTIHLMHQAVYISAQYTDRHSFGLLFTGANEFHFAISRCIAELNTMHQMPIRQGFLNVFIQRDSLHFFFFCYRNDRPGTEWVYVRPMLLEFSSMSSNSISHFTWPCGPLDRIINFE